MGIVDAGDLPELITWDVEKVALRPDLALGICLPTLRHLGRIAPMIEWCDSMP